MESQWPCPICGELIGETGMSSRTGLGISHPVHQHVVCPKCGKRLVRDSESEVAERRTWRLNPLVDEVDDEA